MKKRMEISRQTLDAALPPMTKAYENRAAAVLDHLLSQKEEQVVKRKISTALVLALVIVSLAAAALAATLLWENYARQAKQTEHEQGPYGKWQLKDKMDLLQVLTGNGYIQESDVTRRLFDPSTQGEEANRLADELLMALTQAENVREINLDTITYAIMGFLDTWTPEQRVWWQQITNMYRHPDMIENDTLVKPGSEDIPEKEAVAIASKAIIEAYGLAEDFFGKNTRAVADLYVTEQRPDYRRWNVNLNVYRDDDPDYLIKVYAAVVDSAGNLIADPDMEIPLPEDGARTQENLPGRPQNPLFRKVDALFETMGWMPLRVWPLERKAEFSQTIAPLVRPLVESGDLTLLINGDGPDLSIIAPAMFTYGLPGPQDMRQEEALSLAKRTIKETYGVSDSTLALYDDVSVYFDISNPELPLWKFLFLPGLRSAFEGGLKDHQAWLQYKVEIASATGEVIRAEEFAFESPGYDLDYDLKLY